MTRNWYCFEHHKYFSDMKKHLTAVKHRCKLYNPRYDELCNYKNCIKFAEFDGFCKKHFQVVIVCK